MDPELSQEWDRFVAGCSFGHHEQSSGFAAVRVRYGFEVRHVVHRRGGRIVGGAQILLTATAIGRVALLFKGPLSHEDDPEIMAVVARAVVDLARGQGCTSVRADFMPCQTTAQAALEAAGFAPSVSWEREGEKTSVVVSLDEDEATLLAPMHRSVAYNVRRSRRLGVEVRSGDEACLQDFFRLHLATARYQDFPVFPAEYFEYVRDLFAPTGRVRHFVAYGDGQPRSALFNSVVGDTMYYGWGGMLRDAESRAFRANFMLHVEAMKWAAAQGCAYYDFVGDEPFKQWFGKGRLEWPKPKRCFIGPLSGIRWATLETAHASAAGRRVLNKVGRRLGLIQRLPW